jgi:hypothetical protein
VVQAAGASIGLEGVSNLLRYQKQRIHRGEKEEEHVKVTAVSTGSDELGK